MRRKYREVARQEQYVTISQGVMQLMVWRTGASGFSHAARTAEQVSMCQFAGGNGILQRSGQGTLSHYRLKGGRAVFSVPIRYSFP